MKHWYLLETEKDYNDATRRYEGVRQVHKGTMEHREKLLLALLINQYEERHSSLPDVDPVEMIKIRMEDFGYKPADLARNTVIKEPSARSLITSNPSP